jgi:hypothetical protein
LVLKKLSFQSRLERIAVGMDYFAVSVPLKTTQALGTRGPVPVSARINNSEPFIASLYPIGGGRHYLRVRNKICKAEKIKVGERVKVRFTVRDRSAEVSIPKDLARILRAERVEKEFKSLPIGKRSFLLRLIDKAVKPETRVKRIKDAVKEAKRR